MKNPIIYLFLLCIGPLCGCNATKECLAPDLQLPAQIDTEIDSLQLMDEHWWKFYADETLTRFISITLERNKDLLASEARVRELQYYYRVKRAEMLPQLGGRFYANQETNDYYGEKYVRDPEIGLKADIRWVADLWGNLSWAKKGALATYRQAIEQKRALRMSLVAEVATAYYNLLSLHSELELVRSTLLTRAENVRMAKLRYEGGLTSETVYQQAQVEYASTAAMIPQIETRISSVTNSLSLLMGEYPTTDIGLSPQTNIYDNLADTMPNQVSTTLLLRRPDVRAGEYKLRKAMADVGVAYTDRFPKLSISLIGGVENNAFADLLKSPFSLLSADLLGPIFDFKGKQSKYHASVQAYEQARLGYEQLVLEVFKEANDAAVAYRNARVGVDLQKELCEAARKYLELAQIQYISGSIIYITVLDAQRHFLESQTSLIHAVRDEHLAAVQLYKALGGGWK